MSLVDACASCTLLCQVHAAVDGAKFNVCPKKAEKWAAQIKEAIEAQGHCVICQEGLHERDQTVLTCGHKEWHRNCIAAWLNSKAICPLCRKAN